MSREEDVIRKIGKIYKVGRRYPSIPAEKLLNIRLPYYQKKMLQDLWTTKYPLVNCSRRTGKSYVITLKGVLRCLMYPDYTFLQTAPVFKQAQTCFLMAEDMYKGSLFMQNEVIDRPKHGSSSWKIKFKNGSEIVAAPLSDSLRSIGANGIHLDEAGFPVRGSIKQYISRVLKPMVFTKRDIGGNQLLEGDIGNSFIISSTSTFRWNEFYEIFQDYQEKVAAGKENYKIIQYTFLDGIKSGLFEKELVLEEIRETDPISRKMEYLNVFPDGEDGFINYRLLDEKAIDHPEIQENENYKEPKTKVEFEQPYDSNNLPKYKYIMAVDEANQGNDNTAISLIKIDGNIKRLVRVITLEDDYIQDRIKVIRDLLKRFNVVRIVADQRHSGIKNGLAEPYEYKDGTVSDIIVDMDDRDQIRRVRKECGNTDINKLLKIHNFTNSSNEIRARHLLNEIEKGRFKIPADPRKGYSNKKEEDAYNEIKQTIYEITRIKIKPSGSTVKYEPETRSQKKDRWTVCELGCYMADDYIRNRFKTNSEKITLGKWG